MRLTGAGRAVAGVALVLPLPFAWLIQRPTPHDAAAAPVRVVTVAPATPITAPATESRTLVSAPTMPLPIATPEPPDPTLHSDDEPWGPSWTAIDGEVQPPRVGQPALEPPSEVRALMTLPQPIR